MNTAAFPPSIMDAVMRKVLGLEYIPMPETPNGIPLWLPGYFGVYVRVHRTVVDITRYGSIHRNVVGNASAVQGSRGFLSNDRCTDETLFTQAMMCATYAVYYDNQRNQDRLKVLPITEPTDGPRGTFDPLITDPGARIELIFMTLPLKDVDNTAFNNLTNGLLLIEKNSGKMTTFLPGTIDSMVSLEVMKSRLLLKAGVPSYKTSTYSFKSYNVQTVSSTLIEWMPRTRPYFLQMVQQYDPVRAKDLDNVRSTFVNNMLGKTVNPTSPQAMAMVSRPTSDMIVEMQYRLVNLNRNDLTVPEREIEIPQIALALDRQSQLPRAASDIAFATEYWGISVFQWNWDCQLLAHLPNKDEACIKVYAEMGASVSYRVPTQTNWYIMAMFFEGSKACLELLKFIKPTMVTYEICRIYESRIREQRFQCFYHLSKRFLTENDFLQASPDLALHFINGL